MSLKQVIVVRTDLEMSVGKIAGQVGHASVSSAMLCKPEIIFEWLDYGNGQKKIILQIGSLEELLVIDWLVKSAGIPHFLVHDAGYTEIPAGSATCLGIGPVEDEIIDKITGDLKLL